MDEPTLYVDISFLVNFVMDILLLVSVGRLLGIKLSGIKITIGALVGSVYAVGFLFPAMSVWYTWYFKVLVSWLMILIAFAPLSGKGFLKAAGYFYILNFLIAGAIMGAASLSIKNIHNETPYNWWLLIGIAGLILIIIFGSNLLSRRISPDLLNYSVTLTFDDRCCNGHGFLDTGNGLRDPLSRGPVLVAEYSLIKPCLPDDLKNVLDIGDGDCAILDSIGDTGWNHRIRVIPFTSLGKKNGMLIGIRADKVVVDLGTEKAIHNNVTIGIYRDKLHRQSHYQMLLPAELVFPVVPETLNTEIKTGQSF